MRRNPCELEIDLFCRGVEIDPSCDLAADARPFSRTRAGLGSGLEVVLPGAAPLDRDVWMNVPVEELFVAGTPFLLQRGEAGYEVLDRRSLQTYPVRLPPPPAWYGRHTSAGTEMACVGVLQGTYLGVYVGAPCAFWRVDPPQACAFCTTGLNEAAAPPKTVADVVETARAAKEESGVTFVHLNTGYQRGNALRMITHYVEALKEKVGVLVGVQVVPEAPLVEFDRLIDLGVDHFSFCFEYFDEDAFRRYCPGKDATVGQAGYFAALEHCQSRMPRGSCSGELIAGNESIGKTKEAIDYVTSIGAFPTVCIFRPLAGSQMERWPAPQASDMLDVMRHVWRRCRERGIPIGIAPNIEVSLVVQPTDTAYLGDGGWRDRLYLAKNRWLARLARGRFRRRLRPREAVR